MITVHPAGNINMLDKLNKNIECIRFEYAFNIIRLINI